MDDGTLQGLKVSILATDGFERVVLAEPRKALEQAGAETRAGRRPLPLPPNGVNGARGPSKLPLPACEGLAGRGLG